MSQKSPCTICCRWAASSGSSAAATASRWRTARSPKAARSGSPQPVMRVRPRRAASTDSAAARWLACGATAASAGRSAARSASCSRPRTPKPRSSNGIRFIRSSCATCGSTSTSSPPRSAKPDPSGRVDREDHGDTGGRGRSPGRLESRQPCGAGIATMDPRDQRPAVGEVEPEIGGGAAAELSPPHRSREAVALADLLDQRLGGQASNGGKAESGSVCPVESPSGSVTMCLRPLKVDDCGA